MVSINPNDPLFLRAKAEAEKLDATNDGTSKGFISKSVWEGYVNNLELEGAPPKGIKNCISLERAINSLYSYFKREVTTELPLEEIETSEEVSEPKPVVYERSPLTLLFNYNDRMNFKADLGTLGILEKQLDSTTDPEKRKELQEKRDIVWNNLKKLDDPARVRIEYVEHNFDFTRLNQKNQAQYEELTNRINELSTQIENATLEEAEPLMQQKAELMHERSKFKFTASAEERLDKLKSEFDKYLGKSARSWGSSRSYLNSKKPDGMYRPNGEEDYDKETKGYRDSVNLEFEIDGVTITVKGELGFGYDMKIGGYGLESYTPDSAEAMVFNKKIDISGLKTAEEYYAEILQEKEREDGVKYLLEKYGKK